MEALLGTMAPPAGVWSVTVSPLPTVRQEKPDSPSTVPDVLGKTAAAANTAIANAGLIMKVAGTTASSGNVHAISQSVDPGTELPMGSVVTVWFGDSTVRD